MTAQAAPHREQKKQCLLLDVRQKRGVGLKALDTYKGMQLHRECAFYPEEGQKDCVSWNPCLFGLFSLFVFARTMQQLDINAREGQ